MRMRETKDSNRPGCLDCAGASTAGSAMNQQSEAGRKGGKVAKLTRERRREIVRRAVMARWRKVRHRNA
jgi:hypothetical protein